MEKSMLSNKNPTILNDFLKYLQYTKNFSNGTVQGYEIDLNIFFKFIIEYKELPSSVSSMNIFILAQITESDIIAFLVYLNYYRSNCSSTRHRKIAAVKSFFKWIYIKFPFYIKENPTLKIPEIQSINRLPKYLTLKEAKKIQTIFNKDNSVQYIRNNAIITLFLTTGIRLSELIKINIHDIDYENKTINVICKGNRERVVYFSEYCKKQLLEYLEVRKGIKCEGDPFFVSNQCKRISKSSIENICKEAYRLMGLDQKKYTVHTLRHTAATIYFENNNRDILLLKELLGHTSILSTEIYTHTYNNLAKEAVNKNPLNNFIK